VSLERQCVAGAGMVQINVEMNCNKTPPQLNIIDVLQPPEDSSGKVKNDSISALTLNCTLCSIKKNIRFIFSSFITQMLTDLQNSAN